MAFKRSEIHIRVSGSDLELIQGMQGMLQLPDKTKTIIASLRIAQEAIQNKKIVYPQPLPVPSTIESSIHVDSHTIEPIPSVQETMPNPVVPVPTKVVRKVWHS